MTELIDPLTLGHWEGASFKFDQPFEIVSRDGKTTTVREFDMGTLVAESGITRDDVLHALVNAQALDDLNA